MPYGSIRFKALAVVGLDDNNRALGWPSWDRCALA
jgi:hypothetical protein